LSITQSIETQLNARITSSWWSKHNCFNSSLLVRRYRRLEYETRAAFELNVSYASYHTHFFWECIISYPFFLGMHHIIPIILNVIPTRYFILKMLATLEVNKCMFFYLKSNFQTLNSIIFIAFNRIRLPLEEYI